MKKLQRKVLTGLLTVALCASASLGLAEDTIVPPESTSVATMPSTGNDASSGVKIYKPNRGPLTDGELFVSEMVTKDSKVIFANGKKEDWVWHGDNGYPQGMGFTTIANITSNLPETATIDRMGGVPTREQSLQDAKTKYSIASYGKKLVLYGTTGPSAAKTDIKFLKAELFGRLLNVTVGLTDAEKNQPLTMNLIYPEAVETISLRKLPKYGNLRVRYVDVQGRTLQINDVDLGK
ncbi:MAG: hypothetical protein PHQ45_05715 [Acidaminococcaceae bacterium]|nr:hypothetical protein [Acidaminococcaceae bacterium]